MPEIAVGSATEQDFDGVYALLQQLWPEKEMDRDSIYRVYRLALATGQYHYQVARQGEDIIGFISWGITNNLWAQGRLLHVDDLVVAEKLRGRRLIEQARQYALDHDCRYLDLDSGLFRVDAHRFYERYGYCKRAFNFIYEIKTT